MVRKRKQQEKTREDRRLNRYILWGLIAVELLMSFSFLGYIHIEPISIAVVYIPVLMAGCFLGVWESTLVGVVFGLASMWKASAYYISAGDALFSPMMSGKPLQSVFLSVGARALFGFVVGMLYWLAKRWRHSWIGILAVTSAGKLLHAILVYTFMGWFFPETRFGTADAFTNAFDGENIILIVVQNLIIFSCLLFKRSETGRKLGKRLKFSDRVTASVSSSSKTITFMVCLFFAAAFSVAWYFINRVERVMAWHGVRLSNEMSYDIGHIQIQFLLGLVSLFSLIFLGVFLTLRNFNYLYYEAKLDGLTGAFSREQFFMLGEKMLDKIKNGPKGEMGCFIILDVDFFKQINDRYGHPAGDKVLREVAERLKFVFGDIGIVGRLGGDEFVVLADGLKGENEIAALLEQFRKKVDEIDVLGIKIGCSMGAAPVDGHSTIEELYHIADSLLYEEKKKKGSAAKKPV